MIKSKILCVLLLITQFGYSQNRDSVTISTRIDSLLRESEVLMELNKTELALLHLLKANEISVNLSDSSKLSQISHRLGNYYEQTGDYENALIWYQTSLSIQEKFIGDQGLEYATTLNDLGGIYADMGKVDFAKTYYERALDIREDLLGRDHPDFAGILNNLGGIYQYLGDYEKAIALFSEARQKFSKSLGNKSIRYALAVHNLANVYYETGNFNQAELLYTEALQIRENILGRNNPVTAASINCLGNLYSSIGLKEKALAFYQEALKIYSDTLGKNHLSTSGCMTNIASLLSENGDYKKAETYFLNAMEILETNIGIETPDYALALDNLANMYTSMGKYDLAENYYLKSLGIREKIFGQKHPEYGNSLNNLGSLYSSLNKPDQAEPYFLKARDVWKNIFGDEHPDYILSLNNLICHYWLTNQKEKVSLLLTESINTETRFVFRASKHLTEKELSLYVKSFTTNLDRLFSFNSTSNKLTGLCLNALLFYKGYLLNSTANLSRLAAIDTVNLATYSKIKQAHQNLGKELSLPLEERSIENIAMLEEQINLLEKILTRKLSNGIELQKTTKYQDILKTLKKDEACLEFIHYRLTDPLPKDEISYAVILLKGGIDEPEFINLFEEKALDSLLQFGVNLRSEYVNSLYSILDRGAKTKKQTNRSLEDLIWKALEQKMKGIKTVYYSPSGLLHRINFDAIPINFFATISDSFNLIALGSTRQLLSPERNNFANNSSVLFGGIAFDELTNNDQQFQDLAMRSKSDTIQLVDSKNLKGSAWDFLPGTEREVNNLVKIIQSVGIKTDLKVGYQATEESFKNLGANNSPSPRILHLATHGYFFPDPKEQSKSSGLSDQNEPVFKISDHPMLRSGLIMAGGNAAWQGKQTLEGREDGILTAYEISQMNLSNTELVVLSACETGLGDIQGNEGVYGLQRAFKIAGAKYLIMSLWQVPDKQTSLLMTTFYKKWLENKMAIPDAFHAAQKELRDNGLDPYNWAGFVLVE